MSELHAAIDFNNYIHSVSLALDLAEACAFRDKIRRVNFDVAVPGFSVYTHNFAAHSKRTALISLFLAQRMQYDKKELQNLYMASFMHDIGAVDAFYVCHSDRSFIYEHSDFGAAIIKKLPVDRCISEYIKFHHENHDGSGPNGLAGSDIPEAARIIHAADMLELMYNDDVPGHLQRDKIMTWIRSKKGSLFSPTIIDALEEAASSEKFWLDIENVHGDFGVLMRIQPVICTPLSMDIITDVARVFAAIIDKKSAFTHEHSIGLTNLTERFARLYGFDEKKSREFKIAALLHDLGKLAIPNDILDKPGKLTKEEYIIIKSHTYYTKLILSKIDGMKEIAEWAANHHETLRGTGYPEMLDGSRLSLESRIMTVCDIYQALTENRPYRSGLSRDRALQIIESMRDRGDIDADIIKDLKDIV